MLIPFRVNHYTTYQPAAQLLLLRFSVSLISLSGVVMTVCHFRVERLASSRVHDRFNFLHGVTQVACLLVT